LWLPQRMGRTRRDSDGVILCFPPMRQEQIRRMDGAPIFRAEFRENERNIEGVAFPCLKIQTCGTHIGTAIGGQDLACAEIDEAEQKKCGKDVKQPVLLAIAAGGQVKDGPGNDAETQSVGDGVGERDEHESEEGGDGDQGVVPADFSGWWPASCSRRDERGRGGCRGHDAYKRRGDDGGQEEQSGDDCGDAGTASGSHAGGGLDIAGDGGGSGKGTNDGGGGVCHEDAVKAGME